MSLETTLGITADGIVPPGRAEQARALIRSGRNGGAGEEVPGGRPDRGLPGRALRRPGPARTAAPARRDARPAPARHRPRALAPRGRATATSNAYLHSYRVRNGVLHNPRSDRRTTEGTFHVAEGGLPIPGDKKAVPAAGLRGPVPPRADAAGGAARRAVHGRIGRSRARAFVSLLLRPIVCPEVPGVVRREDDGGPLLRPGRPGEQPRFRRVDLRQRRRPVPARERRRARRRALDRPHRLRHPRAAPDPAHQEGARPAALGRRHRAAAARRDVLERPGREVQRRRGVQAHLPHRRRRDRHPDRRQLLRLLQEGSEDADLLRRQPLRQRRGGARRRGARLRQLQPRRRLRRAELPHATAARSPT